MDQGRSIQIYNQENFRKILPLWPSPSSKDPKEWNEMCGIDGIKENLVMRYHAGLDSTGMSRSILRSKIQASAKDQIYSNDEMCITPPLSPSTPPFQVSLSSEDDESLLRGCKWHEEELTPPPSPSMSSSSFQNHFQNEMVESTMTPPSSPSEQVRAALPRPATPATPDACQRRALPSPNSSSAQPRLDRDPIHMACIGLKGQRLLLTPPAQRRTGSWQPSPAVMESEIVKFLRQDTVPDSPPLPLLHADQATGAGGAMSGGDAGTRQSTSSQRPEGRQPPSPAGVSPEQTVLRSAFAEMVRGRREAARAWVRTRTRMTDEPSADG